MTVRHLTRGAIFLCALLAPLPASAGPADSPAPTLGGQASRVLYMVPGVTKNNGIETEFICTSLATAPIQVGVELFDAAGGDPLNSVSTGDGAQAIPAGGTLTIATGSTIGFHEDVIILGAPSIANIKGGSARIVSTSTRVMCEALLVEKLGATPATISGLKLIARKQSGD
jgi:hypothetical protein